MSSTTTNENNQFIELFNQIQQSFDNKISEETPGFRLYEDVDTSEIDLDSLEVSTFIFKKLLEKGYRVEVVEDLDIINVTSDDRYNIIIKNVNSNVEIKISLNKFREQLLDYDFEPDIFIIDTIKRIEGIKGNNELKELKDDILNYLSFAIHYKELFRYSYSTIGWDRYAFDNKTRIFKYNNIISNNVDIKGLIKEKYRDLYTPSVNLLSTDHKEEDWMNFTIQLMNNHVYDCLLFAVGISGIIRQILTFTKETNLNVNVMGNPGSGKSTIGHYILSFFGKPVLLEGTSIDTENAAERIRAERPVLPYVLDERMLRYFSDSEKKQQNELLLAVFREYEGKEKERLGKQYENTSGQRVYGPIISSSVDCMLQKLIDIGSDLGQYRRFIEINIGKAEDENLFNSEEAYEAENIANSCYGYGVRYIVRYMLYRFEQQDDYFEDQFKIINANIKERLEQAQKVYKLKDLTSSSMRFALIVLSYQILRESFIYKHEAELSNNILKSQDLLSDKTEDIISELIMNLVEKMSRVKDNKKRSLRDYLISVYSVGAEGVSKDSEKWNPVDKEGKFINITKTSSDITIAYLESLNLENALLLPTIPNVEELIGMAKRILNGEDSDFVYNSIGVLSPSEIKKILETNGYEKGRSTKVNNKVTKIKIPLVSVPDSKEEEDTNE